MKVSNLKTMMFMNLLNEKKNPPNNNQNVLGWKCPLTILNVRFICASPPNLRNLQISLMVTRNSSSYVFIYFLSSFIISESMSWKYHIRIFSWHTLMWAPIFILSVSETRNMSGFSTWRKVRDLTCIWFLFPFNIIF